MVQGARGRGRGHVPTCCQPGPRVGPCRRGGRPASASRQVRGSVLAARTRAVVSVRDECAFSLRFRVCPLEQNHGGSERGAGGSRGCSSPSGPPPGAGEQAPLTTASRLRFRCPAPPPLSLSWAFALSSGGRGCPVPSSCASVRRASGGYLPPATGDSLKRLPP